MCTSRYLPVADPVTGIVALSVWFVVFATLFIIGSFTNGILNLNNFGVRLLTNGHRNAGGRSSEWLQNSVQHCRYNAARGKCSLKVAIKRLRRFENHSACLIRLWHVKASKSSLRKAANSAARNRSPCCFNASPEGSQASQKIKKKFSFSENTQKMNLRFLNWKLSDGQRFATFTWNLQVGGFF